MSKERSKVLDYLVYLVVRIFLCIIQALPYNLACSCARGLAWLAYHVNRRHRLVALENLKHAFGDRFNDAERDCIVRNVYIHFLTMLIEFAQLPLRLNIYSWRRYMTISNGDLVVDALLRDRPVFMVTGHFGNWELGGCTFALLGFRSHAVARPLDNPYAEELLKMLRRRTGQELLTKKGSADLMRDLLQENGIIATLGDQDAGPRGLFVDFFHRPASTHKAIAVLALQHNVPLVVVGSPRIGASMLYEGHCEDVIYPEDYAHRPDAVRAITQRFTSALERMIERFPEQYFWLHRRWKHQPKEKSMKKSA